MNPKLKPDTLAKYGDLLRKLNEMPPPPPTADGSIVVTLSPGHEITDPDEAEALGLTVEARRMRADAWRRSVGLLPPLPQPEPPTHKEKP